MRRGMGAHLQPFTTTIFNEMSVLAARTGSINLGQGFPDTDGPPEVAEAAVAAIRAGHNQYPPGAGLPALRQAVADHQRRCYGLEHDPDTEVVVTMGATEAIAAAVLGLCEPGDEVVTLEPYYDSYAATIAMAGARRRVVTLRAPDFALDPDALAAAGLAGRRDLLAQGLRDAGLTTFTPQGTYFVVTDAAPVGATDGVEFCLGLPERVGVVAVPMSVFYDDRDAGRTLVRFAFCKRPEVLAEAAARLKGL